MQITTYSKVIVPAGKYILGDPCYYIQDDDWSPLLESCDYFNQPIGQIGGFNVLAFGTKYGDGSYLDQHKNEYGVDAGIIGLVPLAYEGKPDHGNQEIEFKHDSECWDDNGVLHFGSIVINTAGGDEDEDE